MGIDVLMKWKDVFNQSSIFTDIFCWLGWKIAQGLKYLCDVGQNLVDEMFKLIDFTTYAGLDKLFSVSEIKMLLGGLFAFALIAFGATLILQQDKERPKIIQNLLIAVMVITALPSLMIMLNDLTINAKDAILGTESTLSEQVIAENVVDLLYIDKQGFDNYSVKDGELSGGAVNGFKGSKAKNVDYIDATEKITEDYKNELKSPDYFFNKITVNDDGSAKVEELKSNKFLGIEFTEFFYRYNINFLVIYISLAATTIAFFFVAFKVAKLIFELAAHGIIAPLFAAADLTSGQRTKEILKSLASIYTVLVMAVLMIKLYYMGSAFISTHISSSIIKAFTLLFFALAVIDGPNIIEKVLGIDVGLKSGFQSLVTAMMATRAVKEVSSVVGKVGSATVGAGIGAVAGAFDAKKNYNAEKNALNSEQSSSVNQDNILNNSNNNGSSSENNLYGDNKFQDEQDSNKQQDMTSKESLSNSDSQNNLNENDNLNSSPIDNLKADNDNLSSKGNISDLGSNENIESNNRSLRDNTRAVNNLKGNNDSFNGNIQRKYITSLNPNGVLGTGQRAYHSARELTSSLGDKMINKKLLNDTLNSNDKENSNE